MSTKNNNIRVRIAPSPTGKFHIGTARTALFNYLFAKQNKGDFLLRIEDTDKDRSKKEYEEDIVDGLGWLGLSYDEDLVRQSENQEAHLRAAEILKSKDLAYEKDGALWFKVSKNQEIKFNDLIRGEVVFKTDTIDDFVIVRSDGSPLFYLVGVVDDHLMNISHVIRGEDLLSNTPKQIMLSRALGYKDAIYGHLPVILSPNGGKLSKRKDATSISDYKTSGFLSEAMVNFLALLGWHPTDEREYFSLSELTKEFKIEKVQKSGALFDIRKLENINSHYISQTIIKDKEKYLSWIRQNWPEDISVDYVPKAAIVIENYIDKLSDIKDVVKEFFGPLPSYSKDMLIYKKSDQTKTLRALTLALETLSKIDGWEQKAIHDALLEVVNENNFGMGDVFYSCRVAVSGLKSSPPPEDIMWVLGKDESLSRIDKATKNLS